MGRNKAKNHRRSRPHSQWINVNVEWKQIGDNEENILVGYASVFDGPPDEHGDIISRGAFRKTIKERVKAGKVPLLDSHIYDSAHTLGTIIEAEEDEHGLKIKARLSTAPSVLDIKRKMIEGHLSKLSIGYDSVRERFAKDEVTGNNIRFLDEVKLFEISVVPIPANDRTLISEVKTVVPFQDLPLADRDRPWDSTEAESRVRTAFGGGENLEDLDFTRYRRAFLWFDSEQPENVTSYRLQIADWLDSRLVAIPRALFSVAGVLQGARGGVDIPEADQERIRGIVSRYYAKMREEFDDDTIIPPWEASIMESEQIKQLSEDAQNAIRGALNILEAFIDEIPQEIFDMLQTLLPTLAHEDVAELKAGRRNSNSDMDKLRTALRSIFAVLNDDEKEKLFEDARAYFNFKKDGVVPNQKSGSHTPNMAKAKKLERKMKLLQGEVNLSEYGKGTRIYQ